MVVRADLDAMVAAHPAASTLGEVAVLLARHLDNPATALDGRVAAAVARELRATIADLVDREEAQDDDLFGGLSAPVVVAPQG